jgi:hypothetical protein
VLYSAVISVTHSQRVHTYFKHHRMCLSAPSSKKKSETLELERTKQMHQHLKLLNRLRNADQYTVLNCTLENSPLLSTLDEQCCITSLRG